ncbi:hypothetical protein PhaeoP71_03848 (plasmid) [Phaeobacter piscinae]|nr:hypothetical protein PhaeoP71_03848 [Phaeobacter piscinae]
MRSPAQELTYPAVNSDEDIPAITKIAREAHDESRYRDIPFGEDKIRKLVQGLHRWAKTQNAREVSLHVTSGVDLPRAHKLAIRLGYELTGGNYVANL